MRAQLIPVVLLFNNVAANSNLTISFSSPGIMWCLGVDSGDSLGFSYDVIPDAPNTTSNCIQAISFNDNLLSVRTSASGPASNDFTLTLQLMVDADVKFIQGDCSLNNDAVVLAYFGNGSPMQWRNGRISAVLPPQILNNRGVLFTVKGAKPGAQVVIELGAPEGEVEWTLGPDFSEALGVTLYSDDGSALPLSTLSYGNRRILVRTSTTGSGTQDFSMVAFITWRPTPPLQFRDMRYIYLKTQCDPSVTVYAQVGNTQPQFVSPTNTLFVL
ncbi:MAG: hypothetical protein FD119_859 [Stygiobacter sp.]|nr:MAG: hypothetical protein FD119_859 [Stygiobacter sp.]